MKRIKDFIRTALIRILTLFYRLLRPLVAVDPKTVVFACSSGLNYTGSPRAVYERMVERGLDTEYRCIWFFHANKAPTDLPGRCIVARYEWPAFFWYMMRAGVWIFDTRQPSYLRKKRSQLYIQTWHGTPLKKLALDMTAVNMADCRDVDSYKKAFVRDTALWDCLVAQNSFSEEIFRRCFAFDKEILPIGYPRNDILGRGGDRAYIDGLKQRYGLPLDKKVLLYAPTWRDDQYDRAGRYNFESRLDIKALQEDLGSDYILLVKYHYLVADRLDLSAYKGFAFALPVGAEISDLYLVADGLITDYSSVMFDYSLLARPIYFFTYDLEDYRDRLRGFYFDFLKEAPGPVCLTNAELITAIKEGSGTIPADYKSRYEAFSRKYHEYEHFDAADRLIERFI